MTNCLAPYNEAKSIYTAYSNSGLLNSSIGFLIPVYNNMPQIPSQRPSILDSDYENDNTRVYAEVSGNLNVRSGPGTSYEIITTVTKNDSFTRIKKGIQTGERWDKVVLENGIVGYVFQSYIREVPNNIEIEDIIISNEEINLLINNTFKLSAYVIPQNATEKELIWISEDENIAKVNSNDGTVEAIKEGMTNILVKTKNGLIIKKCKVNVSKAQEGVLVEFDDSLKIDGNEISNLNLEYLKVSQILGLINTNMNLEIYRFDNVKLDEEDKIGTGSKLVIKDEIGNIIYQYKFILYGDVNGDGNINSLDVLVLQKHLLEIKLLSDEFLKAGNISRNGLMPSSLDVLKIQKHILEIKIIEQGDNVPFEVNSRMIKNIEDLNINKETKNNYNDEKFDVINDTNENIDNENLDDINNTDKNIENENYDNDEKEQENIIRDENIDAEGLVDENTNKNDENNKEYTNDKEKNNEENTENIEIDNEDRTENAEINNVESTENDVINSDYNTEIINNENYDENLIQNSLEVIENNKSKEP